MKQNVIKESLKLLQLEKLLIIKKEIGFIENILKYYRGYEENKTNPTKKNIDKLLNDIKSLHIRIGNIEEISKQDKNSIFNIESNINFILFYDYTKIQIEEMLLVIEALYTKMNQLFGEMLNQYLPYPTFFGRRYSSIGLMMYLNNYYQTLLKSLSKPLESYYEDKLVLGWSYNSGFKHKILRNRDIERKNYNYKTLNNYIELPYWYYELPFLIPAITHEVVSIAIKEKDSKLEKQYEKFKKYIEEFFNDKSNLLVRRVSEILGYKFVVKELSKEIFADVISYKIHGFSYLQTIFHNLLGENIAKDFLEIEYKKDGKSIKKYNIKSNDWIFSAKREHNLLRLQFLLNFCRKNDTNKEYIKSMKELLDTIMRLDKSKEDIEGFELYYAKNNPGNKATYTAVKFYMQQVYEHIKNYKKFKKIDSLLDKKIVTYINRNNSIGIDFQQLWDERFETIKQSKGTSVPYKGRFRFEIHKKLSLIDYLQNKKSPDIKVLTLRKARKDIVNKIFKDEKELQDIKNSIESFNHNFNLFNLNTKALFNKIETLNSYKTIKKNLDKFDLSSAFYLSASDIDKLELEDIDKKKLNEIFRYNNILKILDKEETIVLKIKNANDKQKIFNSYLNRYKLLYLLNNYTLIPQMFLNKIKNSIKINTSKKDKLDAWIAYGIYDFAYLETKEKIVDLYEDNCIPLDIDLYYFDNKNILMEVAEPIKGAVNRGDFSLIINIELKKIEFEKSMEINRYNINGYNDLNGAINQLKVALDNQKENFSCARIYKSLGPKDLTIIIEEAKLKTLFSLIKIINRADEVNRTFTIFISNKLDETQNKIDEKIDKNIALTTHIRIPKNSRIFKDNIMDKKYKELLKEINQKGEVYLTTGVMDIVINWKESLDIKGIFQEYEKLLPYMTDYQTKIEKRLNLT